MYLSYEPNNKTRYYRIIMKKYLLLFVLLMLVTSIRAVVSTSRNVNVNQLCVILKNGTVYYYKTSDIEKVNFNDDNSQVELVVKNSDGTTETETLQNVARVRGLKKMDSSEGSGTYVNASGKVEIIDARLA